jgi:hypothetical protein
VINTISAELAGTSTAEANLLSQETGSVTVNAVFKVTADEAQACNILNAFKVTSDDDGSATAEIMAEMIAGPSNANPLLSFPLKTAFKSALSALITEAASGSTQTHGALKINGGASDTTNLMQYFEELIRVYVNEDLEQDGFNNILEAGKVSNITVTIDADAAGLNMFNAMDISDAATATKRKNLIRQADEADLEVYYGYMKEETAADVAFFAPMKGSKSMTFVFDVKVTSPTTITLKNPSGGSYTAAPGGLADRQVQSLSSNSYANDARIAIVVQLDDKNAYFVRDISLAEVADNAIAGSPTNAAQGEALAQAYRALYLSANSGLCPVAKIRNATASGGYNYTLAGVRALSATPSNAECKALGYWYAVGQYAHNRFSATGGEAIPMPNIV